MLSKLPFAAYKGKEPYVFISYSHQDSDTVFQTIRKFHDAGYLVWYDEGIDPGNEWPEEIAAALSGCALFIVFISPRSVNSGNVRNEINYAVADDIPFIAIHIEETELTGGLKLQIGSKQAIMKYRMDDDSFYYKCDTSFKRFGLKPCTVGQVPDGSSLVSGKSAAGESDPSDGQLDAAGASVLKRTGLSEAEREEGAKKYGFSYSEMFMKKPLPIPTDAVQFDISDNCIRKFIGMDVDVVIPSGITRIDDAAFAECSAQSIILPDSLTYIGQDAFRSCWRLQKVVMGNGVTDMGVQVFQDCVELINIQFSNNLTRIPDDAFNGCCRLNRLDVPASVKAIGKEAFKGCAIDHVSLEKTNVGVIGEGAFLHCHSLIGAHLAPELEKIPPHAFARCESLVSVGLPEGLKSIGRGAFLGCTKLFSITIPASVQEIADDAFLGGVSTLCVYPGSYAEGYAKRVGLHPMLLEQESPISN